MSSPSETPEPSRWENAPPAGFELLFGGVLLLVILLLLLRPALAQVGAALPQAAALFAMAHGALALTLLLRIPRAPRSGLALLAQLALAGLANLDPRLLWLSAGLFPGAGLLLWDGLVAPGLRARALAETRDTILIAPLEVALPRLAELPAPLTRELADALLARHDPAELRAALEAAAPRPLTALTLRIRLAAPEDLAAAFALLSAQPALSPELEAALLDDPQWRAVARGEAGAAAARFLISTAPVELRLAVGASIADPHLNAEAAAAAARLCVEVLDEEPDGLAIALAEEAFAALPDAAREGAWRARAETTQSAALLRACRPILSPADLPAILRLLSSEDPLLLDELGQAAGALAEGGMLASAEREQLAGACDETVARLRGVHAPGENRVADGLASGFEGLAAGLRMSPNASP